MELTLEQALEKAQTWLTAPPNPGQPALAVRGKAGSGKTEFLRRLAEQLPEAVYLDCRGLRADDIARRLLQAWGVDDPGQTLIDGVHRLTRDGVALLANVHWADDCVTSSEASRITGDLVSHFTRSSKAAIRFVIERSADRPWVFLPSRNELVLEPSVDAQVDTNLAELLATHPALQALAASELREVPLAVWAELCKILEIRVSQQELTGLPERLPTLLSMSIDAGGRVKVGFRAEAVRHRIRELRQVDHQAIFTALVDSLSGTTGPWRKAGPVGVYTTRVLGLHAIHSGMLDNVLGDGRVLANLEATGLLQALAVRWPRGVPQGGIAIDAHYLERLGLASAPHDEWVAWLHHCALSRGEEGLAGALEREAGGRMPWRTIWSNCRPYGMFGRFGKSDNGAPGYPADGELPAGDIAAQASESRSWPVTEMRPPVRDIFDTVGSRDDICFFRSKRLESGHWLFVGASGTFIVDVQTIPELQPDLPSMPDSFIESCITRAGVWECPAPALAEDASTSEWLEATFHHGTYRRLGDHELPSGLVHTESRQFLTEIGLPALSHQLPFVTTVDVAETGLVPMLWPEGATPRAVAGPFYHLGFWTGGKVLLDGETGAVVADHDTGYGGAILASSLQKFVILLRLCHEFLVSDFATNYERGDALESLREWIEEIDPITEDALIWEHALDADLNRWVAM
ncbi:SUKH-4 family immunity protein [Streptomyces chartreusis]